MEALVTSGAVADLILACLVLEALALLAWRRWRGTGPSVPDILALLLPGAFLVLALRVALTGGPWPLILLALSAALIAHLADLARRFRG